MSEKNSDENSLLLRELLSETLLRDVIIFIILYLFVLAQSWENLFLLLFPIITFAYSVFFRIINTNKWRTTSNSSLITYNPIGLEKKHANRLFFSSILQLILLFWIGAESYYHPQLIQSYDLFFNIIFSFLYTFGFYWILIDVWNYSKIVVGLKNNKLSTQAQNNILLKRDLDKVILHLKLKSFKTVSIINLSTFIFLNILNISFTLFIKNTVSSISYYLPGTGIEGSLPLNISIISFLIVIISPLVASFLLIFIYKDLNKINQTDFDNLLKELPEENRKNIIENLTKINKKFNREFARE
jgi:hypothetical protein